MRARQGPLSKGKRQISKLFPVIRRKTTGERVKFRAYQGLEGLESELNKSFCSNCEGLSLGRGPGDSLARKHVPGRWVKRGKRNGSWTDTLGGCWSETASGNHQEQRQKPQSQGHSRVHNSGWSCGSPDGLQGRECRLLAHRRAAFKQADVPGPSTGRSSKM